MSQEMRYKMRNGCSIVNGDKGETANERKLSQKAKVKKAKDRTVCTM